MPGPCHITMSDCHCQHEAGEDDAFYMGLRGIGSLIVEVGIWFGCMVVVRGVYH